MTEEEIEYLKSKVSYSGEFLEELEGEDEKKKLALEKEGSTWTGAPAALERSCCW